MAKADWSPIPAHQMEEVQQGKCVPRGQQGGGSQGDEEGLVKNSDKEEDQRIKGCTERDTLLFLLHPSPSLPPPPPPHTPIIKKKKEILCVKAQ